MVRKPPVSSLTSWSCLCWIRLETQAECCRALMVATGQAPECLWLHLAWSAHKASACFSNALTTKLSISIQTAQFRKVSPPVYPRLSGWWAP